MKYTKEVYEKMQRDCPIWGFPTEEEKCYGAKLIKTRSLQGCAACQNCKAPDDVKDSFSRFPKGTLLLKETCIIRDLGWRSSYTCTYCLDDWLDDLFDRCGGPA